MKADWVNETFDFIRADIGFPLGIPRESHRSLVPNEMKASGFSRRANAGAQSAEEAPLQRFQAAAPPTYRCKFGLSGHEGD